MHFQLLSGRFKSVKLQKLVGWVPLCDTHPNSGNNQQELAYKRYPHKADKLASAQLRRCSPPPNPLPALRGGGRERGFWMSAKREIILLLCNADKLFWF
jgi:hypothetical protein